MLTQNHIKRRITSQNSTNLNMRVKRRVYVLPKPVLKKFIRKTRKDRRKRLEDITRKKVNYHRVSKESKRSKNVKRRESLKSSGQNLKYLRKKMDQFNDS